MVQFAEMVFSKAEVMISTSEIFDTENLIAERTSSGGRSEWIKMSVIGWY